MSTSAQQKTPTSIIFALTAIFISLVLYWATNLYVFHIPQLMQLVPATFYHYTDTSTLLGVITNSAITLVLMIGIYLAKNWGRYIYIIYMAARLILQANTHAFHQMSGAILMLVLLYCILQLVAFIALFFPGSQLWFRYGNTA